MYGCVETALGGVVRRNAVENGSTAQIGRRMRERVFYGNVS